MKRFIYLSISAFFAFACSNEEANENGQDSFDREALLIHWADNIIIPAHEAFQDEIVDLTEATDDFVNEPTQNHLEDLRSAWLEAYMAWQEVEMFQIGKAEEIAYRNNMNVYPLNAKDMEETLLSGEYDLNSVNRQDEQGFPALDYLLYGLGTNDEAILSHYTDPVEGSLFKSYLSDLTERMNELTETVINDWKNGYRDSFVARSGNTATESVNKMVNDFIFYYEKHLRAGKVGIPAGVFSGEPLEDRVEARYSGKYSKQLLVAGIDAAQDFFNGVPFDGQGRALGLDDYLDMLNTRQEDEDLARLIDAQFDLAREKAQLLNQDLGTQVREDNSLMLQAYDALQKNVVYMKVDMMQALNIQVDYVDADGD
jgi:hypothetical protein